MPQQTFGVGTVPLVLKVGERVTLICSSGCAGFISVPGEAVAQTITAGSMYDYGGYSVQREVVVSISAGTVAVNFNVDGSQFWTQSQADGLQALVSGDGTFGRLMRAASRPQNQNLTIPSAPTITVGVADAASVIASGIDVAFNDARLTPTVPLAQVSAFYPDTLLAKPVYLDNAAPNVAANMDGVFGGYTFSTEATQFEILAKGYSVHCVWVADENDIWYRLTVQTMASTGSLYRVLYDFGGSRKFRRFFVHFTRSVGGVTIPPGDTVIPWTPATPRILVVGDSFTEGTGATTALSGQAQRLGERLGCHASVMPVGLGGTGYVATNSGTRKCAADIVSTSVVPWITSNTIVVWAHGLNDSADVTTNAARCFDAVYAASPLTPQFLFMPFQPRSVTSVATTRTQLLALAAARPWLRVIDNTTYGSYAEITGTGRVGATTGSGNSDWVTSSDNTHPTNAGHEHIGNYRGNRVLQVAWAAY